MDEERRMILRMLEEGKITAEDAVALLKALQPAAEAGEPAGSEPAAAPVSGRERAGRMGSDMARWAETMAGRIAELAEELGERVQRTFGPGSGTEERVQEVGERLERLGRTAGDRLAAAFSQVGRLTYPFQQFAEAFEGTFAPDLAPEVEIVNRGAGSVSVHPDPEMAGRWRLVARFHARGRTPEEAKSASREWLKVDGGGVRLAVDASGALGGYVDLEAWVPSSERLRVSAQAVNGAVSMTAGRAGEVVLRTTNGRIDAAGAHAERLETRTENGGIVLEDVGGGAIVAYSSNGSITGRVTGREARAVTANGSVTLRVDVPPEAAGELTAAGRTLNGSVRIGLGPSVMEAVAQGRLQLALEAASVLGERAIRVPGIAPATEATPAEGSPAPEAPDAGGEAAGRHRLRYRTPGAAAGAAGSAGPVLRVEAETRNGSAVIAAD